MPPKNLAKTTGKANWASIISQADTPTKLLALFALVADAPFIASLAVLPKEQVLNSKVRSFSRDAACRFFADSKTDQPRLYAA